MPEPLSKDTAELHQRLSQIGEEYDKLDSEAKDWAGKRNSLHKQIRKLQDKAHEFKQKRDTLNKRVQELKTLRDEANKKRREKHAQILESRKEIKTLTEKRPSRHMNDLQTEIEKLEWRIQTTPLPLKEEETLIDQIRSLENQLLIHKKLQKLKNNLTEYRTEKEESESQAKNCHTQLLELAEQSQQLHKGMLETLNEATPLHDEADKAHKRFLEAKQKAERLHQQIDIIGEEIHRIEEKDKARHELDLRKELEERALEKLKRGEKLTLDEFKALAEKGII